LYNHYIEEINTDPVELLGQPVDDVESKIIDEEEGLIEDDEQDEFQPD